MPLKHTVEEVQLKNGARGLFINVPGATVVSHEFSFRAGNDYARNSDVQQVAHILEHMAFGATRDYQSSELFSHEMSRYGAQYNATTWDDGIDYYADFAQMDSERMLGLFESAITRPIFTQAALDAEKGNVYEELLGYHNAYARLLAQEMGKAIGRDTMLESERLKTIEHIHLSDVKEHYKRTHTLSNMTFTIAGDLEQCKSDIIQRLESWQMQEGELLPQRQERLHGGSLVYLEKKEMANVSFSLLVGLNRRLSEMERDTMGALNHILTSTFHSRIWGEARRRGICYDVSSNSSDNTTGVALWDVSGEVQQENLIEMTELIIEQLSEVAMGNVTHTELDEAKSYALGNLQLKGQTVSDLIDIYSGNYFDDQKVELLDEAPIAINAVSLESLATLAKEFLSSGIWCFGAVGLIDDASLQMAHKKYAEFFTAV